MAILENPTNYESIRKSEATLSGYEEGLENAVMDYLGGMESATVKYYDLVKEFGGYPIVKEKLKQLMFENRIIIDHKQGEPWQVRLPKSELSEWDTLDSMPCFACPKTDECGMNNPVNPVTCKLFNEWLDDSLLLLDFSYNSE